MYLVTKRLFEIIISLLSIVLLSPLLLIISIIIKCTSRGPILFKQTRVGKNHKPYTMYKFRTMVKDAPCDVGSAELKNAEEYITKFGLFLRKTSLDELPQLFNIFTGKMSIVGPRPCMFTEKSWIEMRDLKNVYSVKPGLTGWAQINGRDNISTAQKVEYDAYYVKNQGFIIDIVIIFKSIFYVIIGKDIFEGSKSEEKQK